MDMDMDMDMVCQPSKKSVVWQRTSLLPQKGMSAASDRQLKEAFQLFDTDVRGAHSRRRRAPTQTLRGQGRSVTEI